MHSFISSIISFDFILFYLYSVPVNHTLVHDTGLNKLNLTGEEALLYSCLPSTASLQVGRRWRLSLRWGRMTEIGVCVCVMQVGGCRAEPSVVRRDRDKRPIESGPSEFPR